MVGRLQRSFRRTQAVAQLILSILYQAILRTGDILSLGSSPPFEHEWHIAPNPSLPHGEPESVIRWELKQNGDSETTLLTLIHSRLTKLTSSWFAPGWHAYLDRLEASINNEVPPDLIQSTRRAQRIIFFIISSTTRFRGPHIR